MSIDESKKQEIINKIIRDTGHEEDYLGDNLIEIDLSKRYLVWFIFNAVFHFYEYFETCSREEMLKNSEEHLRLDPEEQAIRLVTVFDLEDDGKEYDAYLAGIVLKPVDRNKNE